MSTCSSSSCATICFFIVWERDSVVVLNICGNALRVWAGLLGLRAIVGHAEVVMIGPDNVEGQGLAG